MANETQVKQLLELAEDCTKTPVDQLITNADWGTINFDGSRAELDRTFDPPTLIFASSALSSCSSSSSRVCPMPLRTLDIASPSDPLANSMRKERKNTCKSWGKRVALSLALQLCISFSIASPHRERNERPVRLARKQLEGPLHGVLPFFAFHHLDKSYVGNNELSVWLVANRERKNVSVFPHRVLIDYINIHLFFSALVAG